MNFVTFNQDYSYLAVGTCDLALLDWRQLTLARHIERVPHLYDRPLCQEL